MSLTTSQCSIGVIGSGWRADFFFRIAAAIPALVEVRSALTRTEASATSLRQGRGVSARSSWNAFLADGPFDYVVVAVPRAASADIIKRLVRADVAVLAETPPADGLEQLEDLYTVARSGRVQVAEQYPLQPSNAARLAVARSGLLGRVHSVEVSFAHGYHGMSLARSALGAGFGPVSISGQFHNDRVTSVRGRDAWKPDPVEVEDRRIVADLEFGVGTAHYDFGIEQYFSPIRSRSIEMRGTRGELHNDEFAWFVEPGRVASETLNRESTGVDGDLEGSFLRRISAGTGVYFENPFPGARFSDDELAVAILLERMNEFVRSGRSNYSLADGCHDAYLELMIDHAVRSGKRVEVAPPSWATETSDLARLQQ